MLYNVMRGSLQSWDFKKKLWRVTLAILSVAGFWVVSGCSGESNASHESSLPRVSVTFPQRTTISHSVKLVGHVNPWEQVIAYSKVSGYLESISVDLGTWVKEGEVMAHIYDPETISELERQKADMQAKQEIHVRLQSAAGKSPDMVNQLDVEKAKGEYEASLAAVERLQKFVDYSVIRAPFTGVVTERWVDPGALIQVATSSQSPSARIVKIVKFDTVRIAVDVPSSACPKLKKGRAATVTVQDVPGSEYSGRVSRMSWAIDPTTRTMKAEIDIPNENRELLPGMYCEVEILIDENPAALVVPSKALVVQGKKFSVWTVENDQAQRLPVQVGDDDGIRAEIVGGLTESVPIVVMGQQQLRDGMNVEAVESK